MTGFLLPVDTPPMEAHRAKELPEGPGWQFEPKWDGFRCLAFRAGPAVELRAKSGKPLARYFPEIPALLRGLPPSRFVLDGELVISVGGTFSFDALQMRLHPAESRIKKLAVETPAEFIVFDLLATEGAANLLHAPLVERRVALEAFFQSAGPHDSLVLSPYTRRTKKARDWLDTFSTAVDGVIAKRLDGPFEIGMGGDDHHGGPRCMRPQRGQEIQRVAIGKATVENDHADLGERRARENLAHRAGGVNRAMV